MYKIQNRRGFTTLEFLIVLCIVAIIAAILIPSLIDALDDVRQKRVVRDLPNTGIAWMSWLTHQVGPPHDLLDYNSPSEPLFPVILCGCFWANCHTSELHIDSTCSVYPSDFDVPASRNFSATSYDSDIVWADGFFVD